MRWSTNKFIQQWGVHLLEFIATENRGGTECAKKRGILLKVNPRSPSGQVLIPARGLTRSIRRGRVARQRCFCDSWASLRVTPKPQSETSSWAFISNVGCYISSLVMGVRLFAACAYVNRGIGNTLRWRLDVTFREDDCHIHNRILV